MTHTDYRHGEPLPHRLPNRPQPHPMARKRLALPAFKLGSTIRDWPQFPVVVPVHRVDRPRVTELFATVNVQLAWLNRTPIAMASGRINRNVPGTRPGVRRDTSRRDVCIAIVLGSLGDTVPGVTEPSGLTSDSIIYGGPQGSNPHFLRN